MARSGLERRINNLREEIDEVNRDLEIQRDQKEIIRRELMSLHTISYTPSLNTDHKRKPKKSEELRVSLFRKSPGVRDYEQIKMIEKQRKLEEERREFEVARMIRIRELEEVYEQTLNAIRTLEQTLIILVEELERLTLPYSKGEVTGRGRKPQQILVKNKKTFNKDSAKIRKI